MYFRISQYGKGGAERQTIVAVIDRGTRSGPSEATDMRTRRIGAASATPLTRLGTGDSHANRGLARPSGSLNHGYDRNGPYGPKGGLPLRESGALLLAPGWLRQPKLEERRLVGPAGFEPATKGL